MFGTPTIEILSVFYKDNLDHGIAIVLPKESFNLDAVHDFINKELEKELMARRVNVSRVKKKLKDLTLQYNRLVFKSDTRPMNTADTITLDREHVKELYVIAISVFIQVGLLVNKGVLQDDNYNGWHVGTSYK